MKKINVRAEIDRLKALPSARNMQEFFKKTYIFGVQSSYVTDGSAESSVPMEDYLKEWETTHGTMEDFVKERMEQWNRQHSNKKEEQRHGLQT